MKTSSASSALYSSASPFCLLSLSSECRCRILADLHNLLPVAQVEVKSRPNHKWPLVCTYSSFTIQFFSGTAALKYFNLLSEMSLNSLYLSVRLVHVMTRLSRIHLSAYVSIFKVPFPNILCFFFFWGGGGVGAGKLSTM